MRLSHVMHVWQAIRILTLSRPSKKQKTNPAASKTNGTKTNAKAKTTKPAAESKKPVPVTATEAPKVVAVGSYSTGDIDDRTPPPEAQQSRPAARPIEPHMTNAPLRTPRGTRVMPKASHAHDATLNASPRMKGRVTTDNLLETATAHLLKVDPGLKTVIEANHCRVFSPEGLAEEVDPFRSLVSGILAQQVSGAAATSIKNKFIALFNDAGADAPADFPTPSMVAQTEEARLRTAGLSQRKAEYVRGLAEKFASGELTAQMLADATDEEVLEKLIAVRGLGRWSVEMFMMFALKRMDVLSTGDLGIQ